MLRFSLGVGVTYNNFYEVVFKKLKGSFLLLHLLSIQKCSEAVKSVMALEKGLVINLFLWKDLIEIWPSSTKWSLTQKLELLLLISFQPTVILCTLKGILITSGTDRTKAYWALCQLEMLKGCTWHNTDNWWVGIRVWIKYIIPLSRIVYQSRLINKLQILIHQIINFHGTAFHCQVKVQLQWKS